MSRVFAETIMEHAIDVEGDGDNEPDMSGLATVTNEVIRRAQEGGGYEESDEEDDEQGEEDE
jgi:hypothetical protein